MHFLAQLWGGQNLDVVLKPPNSRSGVKALINELICAELAFRLGLPCKEPLLVEVSDQFRKVIVPNSDDPLSSGTSFGSPLIAGTIDPRPEHFAYLENRADLAGMVAFDTWVLNVDRCKLEDVVVSRSEHYPGRCRFWMIDHGKCFGGLAWDRRYLNAQSVEAYGVKNDLGTLRQHIWKARGHVARWASAIEGMSDAEIRAVVDLVPSAWELGDAERDALVTFLDCRRSSLRSALQNHFALNT